MRSSVSASEMRPRPWVAMKLIASGVAFSAATNRSPSFSRSALSTRMTILPLRTSGRIRSTANSLVLAELICIALRLRSARNQPHELGAGFFGVELAGKRRCSRDGMLLLDAAHDHAQVLRFNDDGNSDGFQRVLDAVANIHREPFLNLQA